MSVQVKISEHVWRCPESSYYALWTDFCTGNNQVHVVFCSVLNYYLTIYHIINLFANLATVQLQTELVMVKLLIHI